MCTGQRQVALVTAGNQTLSPLIGTKAVLRSQGMEIVPPRGYLRSLGQEGSKSGYWFKTLRLWVEIRKGLVENAMGRVRLCTIRGSSKGPPHQTDQYRSVYLARR
jgi:hypothetical protein